MLFEQCWFFAWSSIWLPTYNKHHIWLGHGCQERFMVANTGKRPCKAKPSKLQGLALQGLLYFLYWDILSLKFYCLLYTEEQENRFSTLLEKNLILIVQFNLISISVNVKKSIHLFDDLLQKNSRLKIFCLRVISYRRIKKNIKTGW